MDIHIKCGVCGNDMTAHASITESGFIEIIATCPSCKKANETIGDLEDYIFDLEKEVS